MHARAQERFVEFDPLRKGAVSANKFRTALTVAGLDDLTEMDFLALQAKYASPHGVRYGPLIERLELTTVVPNMERYPTSTLPTLAPSSVRKPLAQLSDEDEARVQAILERIRAFVKINRLEVKQPFDDFMRNEHSAKMMHRVTRQQFRQVLGRLHAELTNEEAELLCAKLDTHRDGSVNYVEFAVLVDETVAAALPPALGGSIATATFRSGYRKEHVYSVDPKVEYQPGRPPVGLDEPRLSTAASTVPPAHDELEPLMARFAEKVMVNRLRLKEFFADFDKFNSNKIPIPSFRVALSVAFDRMRIDLTEREFKLLCTAYGDRLVDGSSAVRWRDFIHDVERLIDPPRGIEQEPLLEPRQHSLCAADRLREPPPGREAEWEALRARIRKLTKDRSILLKPTLEDFSKNANSPIVIDHVTRSQLLQGLSALNIPVSPREAELLFHRYDTNGDGTVHFVLFCSEMDDYEQFSQRQSKWNTGIGPGGFNSSKVLPTDSRLPFGTYAQPGRPQPFADEPRLPSQLEAASSAEEVVHELRVAAKKYGLRINEFFADHDRHRSRKLAPAQFRVALRAAFDKRKALTEAQVQALLAQYKTTVDGVTMVRWRDFVDDVNEAFTAKELERRPRDVPISVVTHTSLVELPAEEMAVVDEVIARFAAAVKRRSILLKPPMRDFERNQKSPMMTNRITITQFRQCLARFDLELTNEEYRLLCKRYDSSRDGSFDYVRFCDDVDPAEALGLQNGRTIRSTCGYHHPRVLEPPSQHLDYQPGRPPTTLDQPRLLEKPADTVESLIARMRKKCQAQRLRIEDSFRDHDRLNSGAVTIDQFRSGISQGFDTAGLALTEAEFGMLVSKYARKERGGGGVLLIDWRRFSSDVDPIITGLEQDPLADVPPLLIDRSLPQLSEEKEARVAEIISLIRHRFITRRVLLKPFFTDFAQSRCVRTRARRAAIGASRGTPRSHAAIWLPGLGESREELHRLCVPAREGGGAALTHAATTPTRRRAAPWPQDEGHDRRPRDEEAVPAGALDGWHRAAPGAGERLPSPPPAPLARAHARHATETSTLRLRRPLHHRWSSSTRSSTTPTT